MFALCVNVADNFIRAACNCYLSFASQREDDIIVALRNFVNGIGVNLNRIVFVIIGNNVVAVAFVVNENISTFAAGQVIIALAAFERIIACSANN